MSKVLYIKANPKPEELSRTFKISNAFVEAYKYHHPEDEIITLDLYQENIGFLTEKDVLAHSGTTDGSRQSTAVKYANQFRDCDKYIFAEPLWNLGIPAILKAYFDYITQVGITFKYSPTGPIGLCSGKKSHQHHYTRRRTFRRSIDGSGTRKQLYQNHAEFFWH
jgi:FMN-dependent NADH-azoreductase